MRLTASITGATKRIWNSINSLRLDQPVHNADYTNSKHIGILTGTQSCFTITHCSYLEIIAPSKKRARIGLIGDISSMKPKKNKKKNRSTF